MFHRGKAAFWAILCPPFLFALSFALLVSGNAKGSVCPKPAAGKNLAGFQISCDYSNTTVEQSLEMLNKGVTLGIAPLVGTQSDIAFFNFLGANMGIQMPNLCEGKPTKGELLDRISAIANADNQFLTIGMSGHGGYVPIFKNGKFVGVRWAMLLGNQRIPAHCSNYWTDLKADVESVGIKGAEKKVQAKLKDAKRFSESCLHLFVTADEINERTRGKQSLVIADTCYAAGFCDAKQNPKSLVVPSSTSTKVSYETTQIAASELEGVLKEGEENYLKMYEVNTEKMNKLLDRYFARHPEMLKVVSAYRDHAEKIFAELRADKGDPAQSATLNAIFKELNVPAAERVEFYGPFYHMRDQQEFRDRQEARALHRPPHVMGALNAFLYERDWNTLDKNADKKVSVQEFVGALEKGSPENGFPPFVRGADCDVAWLSHTILDLSKPLQYPKQLKSFQHGEEKLVPSSGQN